MSVFGEQMAAPPRRSLCESCGKKGCSAKVRGAEESDQAFAERRKLQSRMCDIRHKIIVMSGKGGVGKSTVAVNLAMALAMSGLKVGLLDIDIHGPSIPTMLGLELEKVRGGEEGLQPVRVGDLEVMSIGFILKHQDDAVIWRGPKKVSAIKQFLADVIWGPLDCLVIDSPPGTGDEPLAVCQLIHGLDGAVIVTTPQKVAAVDVRKSVNFCHQVGVAILGVVENMNGFVCPQCGAVTHILPTGEGRRMAVDMGLPFLGSLPMDPEVAIAGDSGLVYLAHYPESPTAKIMEKVIAPLVALMRVNCEKSALS